MADRPAQVRALLAVVLLALVLGACDVDGTVRVDVADDGSGTVTALVQLDAAAVRAVEVAGTPLEQAVRLDDLATAGWTVRWRRFQDDGRARLVLRKPFARAEDAGALVRELMGTDGPVRDVQVGRESSTFTTRWSFDAVGDLAAVRTGITTDADLAARLAAERVDVAALDARLTARVAEALRLRIVADLPAADAAATEVPVGETVTVRERSERTDTGRILLVALGVALGALAIVVLVLGELRTRRRRARP